jgi:hypothetical protein
VWTLKTDAISRTDFPFRNQPLRQLSLIWSELWEAGRIERRAFWLPHVLRLSALDQVSHSNSAIPAKIVMIIFAA